MSQGRDEKTGKFINGYVPPNKGSTYLTPVEQFVKKHQAEFLDNLSHLITLSGNEFVQKSSDKNNSIITLLAGSYIRAALDSKGYKAREQILRLLKLNDETINLKLKRTDQESEEKNKIIDVTPQDTKEKIYKLLTGEDL